MDNKEVQELKRKSRSYSIIDGSFATVQSACATSYVVPFAIAMNATNTLIAFFSSIPGLLGPLSQLFSSRLMEKYSRRKIVSKGVFGELLTWLPMILLSVCYYKGIVLSFFPLFLLLSYCLYVVVANISGPAWFSWVGELVEEKDRGKWFAKRTFVHSTISVIFSLLAAIFLDWQKDKGTIFLGFIILFSIGIVARYISRHYLRKQYEQKLELYDGYYFSFWQFLKKAPKNNFGRFTLFRATLDFATYIASPFFAVYMLRNLEFSYVIYMVIALSQTLFSILFVKFWGRFSDRYGNYQIFKITVIIIPIYPLLWLISSNPFYLIFVPQLLGGFAWAGFNLSASNFVYDAVTPQRRGLVVSYYNLLIGVGIFLGATIGGLIALLDIQFMDIILFSFIISAIARGIVCIVMIPMFKEVRNLEKFDNSEIFKIFHINSFIRQIENVVGMNFRKVASWRK